MHLLHFYLNFEKTKKMRWFAFIFMVSITSIRAQNAVSHSTERGNFYFYWGWNRAYYAPSTIHFTGNTYDFQLYDVVALDRQSPFNASLYFNPNTLTIPQYNARFGYYFNHGIQLSLGVDHMKYVMLHDQPSTLNGYIYNTGTSYDGVYVNQPFVITQDFLKFEHTDGLNYINSEIRKATVLYHSRFFEPILHLGGGVGVMVPRTNTTLLANPRYDEFHLAGYGVDGVLALQLFFFKHFFIQGETKIGFIHLPDIRTAMNRSDRASQAILYHQFNVNFGAQFSLLKKTKTTKKNPEKK